jgi:multidrug efflux pump subunit AcrA (membrane-fusion protein)
MFKNRKVLWISLIILALVLAAGGYYAYTTYFLPAEEQASETPQVQTAVARRGDMVIYASGVGSVTPATEIGLGFTSSGTLSELLVNVGDDVQTGAVLARLKTNNTEASLATGITSAQLSVLEAQQALDGIYDNWEMEAAQALLSIEAAQNDLETLHNPALQQAEAAQSLAETQDALDAAQLAYDRTQLTASQANIDDAYADMLIAEQSLERAQENFDRYADKPADNINRAQAQSQLSAAQQKFDSAAANYNAMIGTSSDQEQTLAAADLSVAEARLEEAQREWESAQTGATPGEIAFTQAELAAAQAEWARLKDGPDPAEIELSEIKLANAEAKLASAEEEQVYIDLLAPMDGTVLSISANVGESVSSGSILKLADLSLPLLEVYLDEIDMDKIAVGFEVEVIFDAIPDSTFTGHVIQVDPSLATVQNSQLVKALVQLDEFAKPQTLPVGLNASVDVIGGRAEKAVLIPVEALRQLSPGEYAVFVMENDQPKLQVVSVGLVDFTSAEIITGLEPGDVVTTGIVEAE